MADENTKALSLIPEIDPEEAKRILMEKYRELFGNTKQDSLLSQAKTPEDLEFIKKIRTTQDANFPKVLAEQKRVAEERAAIEKLNKITQKLPPREGIQGRTFIDSDPIRDVDISQFRKTAPIIESGAEQAAKQSALSRLAGAARGAGRVIGKAFEPLTIAETALGSTDTGEHDDRSPEAYQQELNQYRALTPEQQAKFKSRFSAK